jgi:hypothetical protein
MSTNTIAKSILTDRNSEYKAKDVIEIFIPPEVVPMLNPAETYLKWIVEIKNTTHCVQPDVAAASHSLISEIQVFDGQNQQLLEQLEEYNAWTAKKFHYDQTNGLRNMRALMEGQSKVQSPFCTSLYYKPDLVTGNTYRPVECILPIHMSGIFGPTGRVFPSLLTSGLRLRITLESNVRALKMVTTCGFCTTPAPAYADPPVATAAIPNPPTTNDNPRELFFELGTVIAGGAPITSIDCNKTAVSGGQNCNSQTCGFRVGMQIGYQTNTGTLVNLGAIISIVDTGTKIQFNVASITPGAPDAAGLGRKVFVWTSSLDEAPEFAVRNVEMVCSVVEAKQEVINAMVQKVNSGNVKLDFTSYNLYRDNLNAGVNRPNILLNATEYRAMSLLSCPSKTQNSYLDSNFNSIGDGMTSYQMNIAQRLTPNRRVDTSRVGSIVNNLEWNAIHQHELKKSLARFQIAPRFLCNNKKMFCIGRELAKRGKSFDANSQEIRLDFEYSTAAGNNQLEKLLHTWMYHIRTLVISPNSLAVVF